MIPKAFVICALIASIFTKNAEGHCSWEGKNPVSIMQCRDGGGETYEANCESEVNYYGSVSCSDYGNWRYPSNDFVIYLKNATEDPLTERVSNYIKLVITDGVMVAIPSSVYTMSRLKTFTITNNKIEKVNFNNFLTLSNLETINLANNSINIIETDGESSSNSGVQDIDISYNLIEAVPDNFLKRFVELQNLNLSHNKISSIGLFTFEGFVKLETLDISHNRLLKTGYSLTKLPNLLSLSLSYNNMTKLLDSNFVTLSYLEKLYISNNNLSFIETDTFQSLTNLEVLDLSNNKIEIISKQWFNNNKKLNSVLFAHNYVQSIEADGFKGNKIAEFTIQSNQLKGAIGKDIFQGIDVTELNLSDGHISSIEDEAFSHMSQLYSLNLSSNALITLSYLAFHSLESLEILDLSHNQLSDLNFETESLKNLSKLYAQHNNIEVIDEKLFQNAISLKEVDLSFNNIKEIGPYKFLKTLLYLDLSFNENMKIIDSTFQNVTQLNKLSLANVRTEVTFENYNVSIDILDLQSCAIGDLNKVYIYNIQNAKVVNLSANEISVITMDSIKTMPSLTDLDLSLNKITHIQPGSFLNVNNLKYLNLCGNHLQSIDFGVFNGPAVLNNLNLSSNFLSTINFKSLPTIGKLSLDNNVIDYLNFNQLFDTEISVISIGENQIPCYVLAELKYSNVSDKFNSIVTTNTLNYYSENVNGIYCRNAQKDVNGLVVDNQISYISPLITLLKSAIDSNSKSIKALVEIASKTEKEIEEFKESSDAKLTDISNQISEVRKYSYISNDSNLVEERFQLDDGNNTNSLNSVV